MRIQGRKLSMKTWFLVSSAKYGQAKPPVSCDVFYFIADILNGRNYLVLSQPDRPDSIISRLNIALMVEEVHTQ